MTDSDETPYVTRGDGLVRHVPCGTLLVWRRTPGEDALRVLAPWCDRCQTFVRDDADLDPAGALAAGLEEEGWS